MGMMDSPFVIGALGMMDNPPGGVRAGSSRTIRGGEFDRTIRMIQAVPWPRDSS
jgi:hypothetical protein